MQDTGKKQSNQSQISQEALTKFHLATKHVYLVEHLHYIGILQSPKCTIYFNGNIMNSGHLLEYPALLNTILTDKHIHPLIRASIKLKLLQMLFNL